jgi:division protein CdvB (Snf7/Vps24/ESCRT-III family)
MQERDSALQAKCVSALQSKNVATARIYATECAEIRKIAKIVLQSQLALEQVALRLETLKEFGDIVHVMGPVISIVGTVKSQLRAILPEISAELGQVNESLEYLVLEIGEATDQTFDVSASSEEAQRILQEASTVAEQKMKERFPELPSVPSPEARAG